ncbi:MAG: hypothetical protein JW703_03795 [Candidatus Diapherotrites archaeon]|nr:hypothetical protein [Candidatus Diapherotrites archaeon]
MVLRKTKHPSRKQGFGSIEFLERVAKEKEARQKLVQTLKAIKEKKSKK